MHTCRGTSVQYPYQENLRVGLTSVFAFAITWDIRQSLELLFADRETPPVEPPQKHLAAAAALILLPARPSATGHTEAVKQVIDIYGHLAGCAWRGLVPQVQIFERC